MPPLAAVLPPHPGTNTTLFTRMSVLFLYISAHPGSGEKRLSLQTWHWQGEHKQKREADSQKSKPKEKNRGTLRCKGKSLVAETNNGRTYGQGTININTIPCPLVVRIDNRIVILERGKELMKNQIKLAKNLLGGKHLRLGQRVINLRQTSQLGRKGGPRVGEDFPPEVF